MNSLSKINREVLALRKTIKRNSPAILTVLGVCGFATTTVMAVKATPKANDILEKVEKELPEDMPKAKKIFYKTKAVAPVYAPSVLMGLTSGFCIFKAYNISTENLAGAITACELKDQAIKEYQNKVIETIGEKKEQAIRDDIAKDRVANSKYEEDKVIQASTGTQLFMDSISGRYFRSTKDDIYNALLKFQRNLLLEDFMTLNEWYDEIPLEHLKDMGDRLGFNSTVGIEIYFSVQEAPNGEPVTVLEYRNPPTYDFCFNHHSDRYWQ